MHWDLIFIYFIYGLGFFSMGLVMTLEVSRKPSLGIDLQLLPLAIFGLLHGLHEWLEMLLMQSVWLGSSLPPQVSTIRLVLLAISFIFLYYFGIKSFNIRTTSKTFRGVVFFLILGIFLVVFLKNFLVYTNIFSKNTPVTLDIFIRYFLAVPAALFTSIGFFQRAIRYRIEDRMLLSRSIMAVGLAFFIYGFSQLIVSYVDMFPVVFLNQSNFSQAFGFPVQLLRAITAFTIMVGMVIAVTRIETDRQEQYAMAQKDRFDALEQIQEELTKRETMRKELLQHIVRAQEDERSRLARELHDETSQVLSAFSLDLATLKKYSSDNREVPNIVDRLQTLSKKMSQGLFRLVHDLRPAQLDDLGLVSALMYLTQKENYPKGFRPQLVIEGEQRRLDPIVETVLFRVAQEAIANTLKHSQSNTSTVNLFFAKEQVVMRIQDEGIGFNTADNFSPPHGWGLAGMQERVDSVVGELKIISSPGNGTIIEVVIPTDMGTEELE